MGQEEDRTIHTENSFTSDVYFFENDVQSNYSTWSDNAVEYFNLPENYHINTLDIWLQKIHPDDREFYKQEIDSVFSGQKRKHNCQYRVLNKHNEYVWIECFGSVVDDTNGIAKYFVGVMNQIDPRTEVYPKKVIPDDSFAFKHHKELLEDIKQAQYANLSNAGVIIATRMNSSEKYYAMEQQEHMVTMIQEKFPSAKFYTENNRIIVLVFEISYFMFRDEYKAINQYTHSFKNSYISIGSGWCPNAHELPGQIVIADSYQQIIQKRQLDSNQKQYYAMDSLTGLISFECFHDLAVEILESPYIQDDFVFVFYDIEDFKSINSTYGFEYGNKIMKKIAKIIHSAFSNYIVCRTSDDHFLALTNKDQLKQKLDNVHRKVLSLLSKTPIEIKAGICVYNSGMSVMKAMDFADVALHTIKGDYSKYYCYYDEKLQEQTEKEKYIIDNIDKAIENEYLTVYYQPVFRVLSGEVCGMESLARWIDPQLGFLSPGDFIPVLENHNLINKVDYYVLKRVCQDINYSKLIGEKTVPVSVNFSRKDFLLEDVFERAMQILDENHVSHDLIHIEITESALNDNSDLIKTVEKFRTAGCEVWLDDFGSQYSSLNALQNFNFDTIKIDMKFFENLDENSNARIIVSSIMDMCKQMHKNVLSEGIETAYQYNFLKKMGCDKMQGYLFAKPMPLDSIYNNNSIIEDEESRKYYEEIGKVNFQNPSLNLETEEFGLFQTVPISIFQLQGKAFSYLYYNSSFEKCLDSLGLSDIHQVNDLLHDHDYDLYTKLAQITKQSAESHQHVRTLLDYHGKIVSLQVVCIANNYDKAAYVLNISNISDLVDIKRVKHLDTTLKYVYSIYNRVDLLDINNNYIENIYTGPSYYRSKFDGLNIQEGIDEYASKDVVETDIEKFKTFYNLKTMDERITASGKGFISRVIETNKTIDNPNAPQLYTIIRIYNGVDTKYLSCVRDLREDEIGKEASQSNTNVQRLQSWYQSISQEMGISMFEWNIQEEKVYASSGCYKYIISHQKAIDILSGTADYSSVYPEDVSVLKQFFKEASDKDTEKIDVKLRLKMVEGGYDWVRVIVNIDHDEDGFRTKMIGILIDNPDVEPVVTHIKDFMNILPIGIGIYECFNTDPRQLYINDIYYENLKDTRSHRNAELKKGPLNHVHDDDRQMVQDHIQKILDGKDRFSCVARLLCGDEQYRSFKIDAIAGSRDSKCVRMICCFTPIEEILS